MGSFAGRNVFLSPLAPHRLNRLQFPHVAAHVKFDGTATDKTIFDIDLRIFRAIDHRSKVFTAKRAKDFGFFHAMIIL